MPPLAFLQVLRNGDGATRGLAGPRAVAVSPDGRFLYAAGFLDGSLALFRRDPAGDLAFLTALDGFPQIRSLAVSADGLHVYAGSDAGIALLTRGSDGRLRRGAAVGPAAVRALELSPDGRHLYAASADGIHGYRRDPIAGALTPMAGTASLADVVALALSPDGASLYAVSYADDSLAVFSRDAASGDLSGLELHRDQIGGVNGMRGPAAVRVAPDGTDVYVAGLQGLTVFLRAPDTHRLTFAATRSYFAATNGCPPAPASAVATTSDGEFVFAARAGDAAIAAFRRLPDAGGLVLTDLLEDDRGGRGCEDVFAFAVAAVGEADASIYASGLSADRLSQVRLDRDEGLLLFVSEQRNGGGGVVGLAGATRAIVSPDRRHVYTAALDGIAAFARDDDGSLHFLASAPGPAPGLGPLSGLAPSPDGTQLYVVGTGDRLSVWARDAESGRLAWAQELRNGVDGVAGLAGHSSVVVSPDGDDVYVASAGDEAIAVFGRNPGDGTLSFSGVHRQGIGGFDGLAGVAALGLDADGRHLYAASVGGGGTVTLYRRDPASGELTFGSIYRNRTGGIDGLGGATALAIAADGRHLYVAGFLDSAIAIFARDPTSGALGFTGVVRDQPALTGIRSLALHPAGHRLFAVSSAGALSAYQRSSTFGGLVRLATLRDGVDGLAGAEALALDPDGHNVYVVAPVEAALTTFRTATP